MHDKTCRHFNWDTGTSPSFKFEHVCSACEQPSHGIHGAGTSLTKAQPRTPPLSRHCLTYNNNCTFIPGLAICAYPTFHCTPVCSCIYTRNLLLLCLHWCQLNCHYYERMSPLQWRAVMYMYMYLPCLGSPSTTGGHHHCYRAPSQCGKVVYALPCH